MSGSPCRINTEYSWFSVAVTCNWNGLCYANRLGDLLLESRVIAGRRKRLLPPTYQIKNWRAYSHARWWSSQVCSCQLASTLDSQHESILHLRNNACLNASLQDDQFVVLSFSGGATAYGLPAIVLDSSSDSPEAICATKPYEPEPLQRFILRLGFDRTPRLATKPPIRRRERHPERLHTQSERPWPHLQTWPQSRRIVRT